MSAGSVSKGDGAGAHVIARTDYFGPTIYMTDDKRWVFGEQAKEAFIFTDEERSLWTLDVGTEWRPASDLAMGKGGEKS